MVDPGFGEGMHGQEVGQSRCLILMAFSAEYVLQRALRSLTLYSAINQDNINANVLYICPSMRTRLLPSSLLNSFFERHTLTSHSL